MSIYSILNVARGALAATQTAMQVTSNNIANVNTAGYARQEAVLEEARPTPSPAGLMGDGVTVKTIKRFYDKYLESSIRTKNSDAEGNSVLSTYLDRIQQFLNEDNSHLAGNITTYFNDWQSLSTDPQNTGMKQTIVSQGQTLAQSIQTLYSNLKDLQSELNDQVNSEVDSANTILASIATLNTQIIENGADQASTNIYQDQKTSLLNELSKKLSIQTFDDKYGRTTVLTAGGKPLVEDGSALKFTIVPGATTGYSKVGLEDSSGTITDITSDLGGGKFKALIDTRDTYVVGFLDDLDTMSAALIDNTKWTAQIGGFITGTSFFQGTGAADIAVTDSLVADPTSFSASSDPTGKPSDNDIAVRIAALVEKTLIGSQQLVHASGSDALSNTYSSAGTAMTSLLGLSSAWSGTIQIKGTDGVAKSVSIDLSQDTLTQIRDKINNAAPTGVTASLATTTTNGVTSYQLKLTNVDATDLTDQNGVLQTLGLVTGTTTLTDFASSMVSNAGQLAQDAENAAQTSSDSAAVLTAQREGVSGVSIDEEMANLIKYQYAYQASAKLFSIADELLQSLLAVT